MRVIHWGTALLIFALGCGSGDPERPGPAGAPGGRAGSGSLGAGGGGGGSGGNSGSGGSAGKGPPFTGNVLSERITVKGAPPGSESHVCVTKRLPNDTDVWVNRIRARISDGSHHLIVDRDRSTTEVLEPRPCAPLSGTDASRILIAQQHETEMALPEGVAYQIPAFQFVTLELHYFNTTSGPIDVEGVFELDVLASATPAPIPAEMLFTGTNQILIPAHSPGTATFFGKPRGTPQDPAHVFGMTSHTHSRGVRATIERVATAQGPSGELLHESLDWAEPPLTTFNPALVFTGSDGLRLTCQYQNDTSAPISFGIGVDQEMCFLWLYYYPAGGSLF